MVKIEDLCGTENGPISVTKNGCGRLVVMVIEYFDRLMGQAYEAILINEGISDLESDRVKRR